MMRFWNDENHLLAVREHPKEIEARVDSLLGAEIRRARYPYCKVHGTTIDHCTYGNLTCNVDDGDAEEKDSQLTEKIVDGFNVVFVGNRGFHGVFRDGVMLFGIMTYLGKSVLCRATIDGTILSDILEIDYFMDSDLNYDSFSTVKDGKYEFWPDTRLKISDFRQVKGQKRSGRSRKSKGVECTDSDIIYLTKTEFEVTIWCESVSDDSGRIPHGTETPPGSEIYKYKMVFFADWGCYDDFGSHGNTFCGIPIYDEKQRQVSISGHGLYRLCHGNIFECKCPSIGACRCVHSCTNRSQQLTVWGNFDEKGVPYGDVHIKRNGQFSFVGHLVNGRWEGEGTLDVYNPDQLWQGNVKDGVFSGMIAYHDDGLTAVARVKCHLSESGSRLDTLHYPNNYCCAFAKRGSGEAVKLRSYNKSPETYVRGSEFCIMPCSDLFEGASGEDCVRYDFRWNYLMQGKFIGGKLILKGQIEKSAVELWRLLVKAKDRMCDESAGPRSLCTCGSYEHYEYDIDAVCRTMEESKDYEKQLQDLRDLQKKMYNYVGSDRAYDDNVPMQDVELLFCGKMFHIRLPYFPMYQGQLRIGDWKRVV